MNLLQDAWIPIRREGGSQSWINPSQISELDIVALDAARADFNGALIQFLIGLLQTTTPMDSSFEWKQWYENPPSNEQLQQWFEVVETAFEFDGDGARFMQDFSLRTEGVADKDFNSISALLIESPGDNTLKGNKDHFIKRNFVAGLCPCCAATAVFTLQTNAPSGGNGHYTSIRGGGPLTTLIIPGSSKSLWHTLWLNIRERSQFLAGCGNADLKEQVFQFPWMENMAQIQAPGGKTAPVQVHPSHIYWGMPRRIRLDLDNLSNGDCGVCGRETKHLITRYLTKAKGLDYKGAWFHPLSPYYENKPGEYLPVHPGPDGFGYKHWLGWVLGLQRDKRKVQPASAVTHVLHGERLGHQQLRLWVFGFDMDSMKARCWYESTFPLYGLADCDQDSISLVQSEVAKWLEAADQVAYMLRSAVKSAWFSDGADVKGDWSFIDSSFWARSEARFYQLLRKLIAQARNIEDDAILQPSRNDWRKRLIDTAETLFDADLVGAAPIERQNPRRVADAYNRLHAGLIGNKLKSTLHIPVEKKSKATKNRNKNTA